jgi:hypothetical protein
MVSAQDAQKNILPKADPRRDRGLIYFDESLKNKPATHALIIGAGHFRGKMKELTTTTISARAVADWLLDEFRNDEKPLGSLTLLLSEAGAPAEARAEYRGGPAARATLGNAKKAVVDWFDDRLSRSADNLAFLFVCSHGQTKNGKTAFLLEDYRNNPDDPADPVYGMTCAEDLAAQLEFAMATSQILLFDCCRNEDLVDLARDTPYGDPLIRRARADNDHGEQRRQARIFATSMDEQAIGRQNDTTLFSAALLKGLKGVAGDPGGGADWPVTTGKLIDQTQRLLGLYRLRDERKQIIAPERAQSFDICFASDTTTVPVFLSRDDPEKWRTSEILIDPVGARQKKILGSETGAPFSEITLDDNQDFVVTVSSDGEKVGPVKRRAKAPATFVEIDKDAARAVSRIERPAQTGKATVEIVAPAGVTVQAGAIVTLTRDDGPGAAKQRIPVAIGAATTIDVEPGDYKIAMRTTDGAVDTQFASLKTGEALSVRFDGATSKHEWLGGAVLQGVAPSRPKKPVKEPLSLEAAIDMLTERGNLPRKGRLEELPGGLTGVPGLEDFVRPMEVDLGGALGSPHHSDVRRPPPSPRPDIVFSKVGRLDFDLKLTEAEVQITFSRGPDDDPEYLLFSLTDAAPRRLAPEFDSRLTAPVFVRVVIDGRSELLALPSCGDEFRSLWSPQVIVDLNRPIDQSAAAVVVQSPEWAGLLGFLASRDFMSAGRVFEGALMGAAVAAFRAKVENPLAAAAGAFVVVAAAQPDVRQEWDRWLVNLDQRFPGLPDGPIIRARRLLSQEATPERTKLARDCLVEGFRRGPPVYSLSVDWLTRGLDALAPKDPSLEEMAQVARRFANRVDSTRLFTVVREN